MGVKDKFWLPRYPVSFSNIKVDVDKERLLKVVVPKVYLDANQELGKVYPKPSNLGFSFYQEVNVADLNGGKAATATSTSWLFKFMISIIQYALFFKNGE